MKCLLGAPQGPRASPFRSRTRGVQHGGGSDDSWPCATLSLRIERRFLGSAAHGQDRVMPDPHEFRRTMTRARQCLLADPGPAGEEQARDLLRRFLMEAESPSTILDRLEDALLDAAYRGRWESGYRSGPPLDPGQGPSGPTRPAPRAL